MDLQGIQSMVLTLGNGQIWLGTPPVVLQFILEFFHMWSANASSRNTLVLILTWENDRMLSIVCVFEKL